MTPLESGDYCQLVVPSIPASSALGSAMALRCYSLVPRSPSSLPAITRQRRSHHVRCGDLSRITSDDDLPEALQGLSLNSQGLLVDERSGKVINEMGATRWDVAVSAMRGLLDPPDWVENTERTDGLILSSLVQFPHRHCFSIVGRNEPGFLQDCVATIQRVCQVQVDMAADVKVVKRLSGKFLSLQVDCMVRAPELITRVLIELAKDPRVKMRY
ncbi:hypothetical protein QJQ45_026402 [Haematococcus lacustris]|nr:hypothetical protein QJQ45_026402 [Haematococcus lacustris]